MSGCLAEDDLLVLERGGSLADAPGAEAHLADCAACSALVALIARDLAAGSDPDHGVPAWNARAGTTLGPYCLDHQIGAGGMGAVYRARDPRLGRVVAIKVLHAAAQAARLTAEARAAAMIGHPGVVAIHDVGTADGVSYVAMELVEGESLRSVIDRGPVDPARARDLAIELARGLAAAHARGVVHRDLKPENLIVTRDGPLKILDFGLAQQAEGSPVDATAPGTVHGTAGYLAPEQARGEPTDARADLFAVGAIVFELVTGRRAFDGPTHADRMTAVLRDTPALGPLGALGPLVARCLAKDPRDRFHSAADLAWALAAPAPTPAPAAPPSRRTVVVGAGAAAVAALGGFVLGRRGPRAHQPRFRQLTYRMGRVSTARFTHDGARIIYGAAWDGDRLVLHALDLAAGQTRPLALPEADVLAVSDRGELAVSLGRRFTDHQSTTGRLAVVPLAGGAPRPLLDDVQDADYAPGGALAIGRRDRRGFRLELPAGTPVVDGAPWITHPRVSPDGSQLAYLAHPSVNNDAGTLNVVDLVTRQPRILAAGWTSIAGLAWDPDGREIWFSAAPSGALNTIRAVTLDGAVREIAQATGRLRIHDLSRDRRAAVTLDVWRLRTMVGVPGVAGERDRSRSEVSLVTDLAADGSALLVGELGDVDSFGTYLVPATGGEALHVGPGLPLAVSPSGTRILAHVVAEPGDRFVVYSTTSAEQGAIATPGRIGAARWIDDTALVGAGPADDPSARMWRLSLAASPSPLSPPGEAGHPALDPVRRRCAFVDAAGRLHVIDLARGASVTLPGSFVRQVACGWLDRDQAIVVRSTTTPVQLSLVDPVSGATTPYLEIAPPPVGLKAVDSFVLRADGSLYAYSYGQELSQLYLMS